MCKIHPPRTVVDVDNGKDGELVTRVVAAAFDDGGELSEVGAHPVGELHMTLDWLGLERLSLDADGQRGRGEVAECEVGDVDALTCEVREALGEAVGPPCRLEKMP
jgi:hypothetical protein